MAKARKKIPVKPKATVTVEAEEVETLLMPLQDDVAPASEEVAKPELPEYDFSAREVTVTIRYASWFSGRRYHTEGQEITISGETARIFRNKGII